MVRPGDAPRNQRVSLSHREHKEWKLHITNVQEVSISSLLPGRGQSWRCTAVQVDRGWYMCQVNTDPMRSQKGYIEVQVPPSIVDTRSSTDLVVREKEKVRRVVEELAMLRVGGWLYGVLWW